MSKSSSQFSCHKQTAELQWSSLYTENCMREYYNFIQQSNMTWKTEEGSSPSSTHTHSSDCLLLCPNYSTIPFYLDNSSSHSFRVGHRVMKSLIFPSAYNVYTFFFSHSRKIISFWTQYRLTMIFSTLGNRGSLPSGFRGLDPISFELILCKG